MVAYLTSVLKLCLQVTEVSIYLLYQGVQLILQDYGNVWAPQQAREALQGCQCLQ